MRDELQERLARIVELVKVRDGATRELQRLLGISKGEGHIVSRETIPEKIKIKRKDGTNVNLDKFKPECTKCSTGRKGRHNEGCNRTKTSTVKVERKEPEPDRPLEGFTADWRSKCCNDRLLVRGGGPGHETAHYECFKCTNPCDPVMPEPESEIERIKRFECEDCGKKFEADTSEDIKCECGSSNVWPA